MAPPEGLREWAGKRIGELLQQPPDHCEDIVEHILTFEDASELSDFLANFAEQTAEHRISSFVSELFERKNPGRGPPKNETEAKERHSGGKGESKGGKGDGKGDGKGRGRGRGKGGRDDDAEKHRQADFPRMLMPTRPKDRDDKRLIIIDAASGRHNIITNCLNCGKVIAEEEGWGPCLFCGNPLEHDGGFGATTGDDRGYMESAGRTAGEQEKFNASFESAKATKDRLLSYDRDAKKRTKVYDDATDWYTEKDNPWLTERQREDAARRGAEEEKNKKEEKRKIHARIDLFGRTVIDASAEVAKETEKKNKDSYEDWQDKVVDENKKRTEQSLGRLLESEQKGMGGTSQLSGDSQTLYNRLRASLHETGKQLQKDANKSGFAQKPEAANHTDAKKSTRWDASVDENRIENEFTAISTTTFAGSEAELLPIEESPYANGDDRGHCLSMHQPWASLLVYGFKRAEGRSWKHAHRGRLWIHSAAKPPEPEQIKELEQRYRMLYKKAGVPIPAMPSEGSGYPCSALLGCVDVEACWSNDEYTSIIKSNPSMPPEESDSEHVFWCLRPRRLVVPLKMGGDFKIWRLPSSCMHAAQRGLQPVRWPAGGNALFSPAIERRPPGCAEEEWDEDEDEVEEPLMAASDPAVASATTAGAAQKAAQPKPKVRALPARAAAPWLDLWPAAQAEERLEVVQPDRAADRDLVVLQDGFVQLVGFVPTDIQQRIIDEMREIGVSSKGFFAEQFDGVKVSKDVSRMYLGMHWNAQARRWDTSRSNLDGEPAPAIPKFLLDMYSEAVKRANRELARGPNKKRKLAAFPEGRAPSLAVANFFPNSATMQIHQDSTESKESIAAGYPVMGICIGDSCDLPYGTEQPTASQKPKTLRLESGDVYLFGGSSRMLWHGVSRVIPRSAPPSLRLLPGRLSITLRVN